MHTAARSAAALVLAGVLVAACAAAEKVVGPYADGTGIDLAADQTLAIELPSNPSTGYSWQVVDLPAQLDKSGEPEFSSGSNDAEVVGAGGTETLRFAAAETGTGTLYLEYRRPWETTATAQDAFELEVTVP